MRIVFTYLVLLAFLTQLGSRLYVLVNFQINKEYIAENLCENKEEPESCCEGSCHLTKELVKVEEAENQGPLKTEDSKKEKLEDVFNFNSSIKMFFQVNSADVAKVVTDNFRIKKGYLPSVFHPPSLFI